MVGMNVLFGVKNIIINKVNLEQGHTLLYRIWFNGFQMFYGPEIIRNIYTLLIVKDGSGTHTFDQNGFRTQYVQCNE